MRTYYKPGSWNAICDRCGFKLKAEGITKEWTGLMVCNECYEARNPQDFLRVPKEDTSTPWTRPDTSSYTYVAVSTALQTETLVVIPTLVIEGSDLPILTES